MDKLVLHLNSTCISTEKLKNLFQKLKEKGLFKNEKTPWIVLLKLLIEKLSEAHSDVLLQNIFKLIKSLNKQPLKDDDASRKEAKLLLKSLGDLVTHIHSSLNETNAAKSDLSRVMVAILPVIIDLKVQIVQQEKSATADVIYNKLSSLLGHSPEHLIDVLLDCKTLIYSKLREPEIFVPIIKREFSSLKALRSSLSPELFLKYLVLAKFLLFMTPKNELLQTRAQVVGLLRLPSSFSEWVSQNQIEWLQCNKLDTKTILKNIVISTVLQTLYSKNGGVLSTEKKKTRQDSKSTLSSESPGTLVCTNGTGSQFENKKTTNNLSETDKDISDNPNFEKSRKHKRKLCEGTSEMPISTKKKKKKSKAKITVNADSSVDETQENGHWIKEIIPENTKYKSDATEKLSSSKEGNNNIDEKVNMEQSIEVDSNVNTHSVKKKKKNRKKNKKQKTGPEMGESKEGMKSVSETNAKDEIIREICDLTSIGVKKQKKKAKKRSKDSTQAVDVLSIASGADEKVASHKPTCPDTTNEKCIKNEVQDSYFISESLLGNEKPKVKKLKKKKQKLSADPKECLICPIDPVGSSTLESSEVNMEGKCENNFLKTSEVTSKKKKKTLFEDVVESLPKKRKPESEQCPVKEKPESSKTPLYVISTTVIEETNISKKKEKKKICEKNSNVSEKGKKLKKAAQARTVQVAKASSEIVLGKSANIGVGKMKDKQIRDKNKNAEFPKEDIVKCKGKLVIGKEEDLSEYKPEECASNPEISACEKRKIKKKKSLKEVCNVECEVKLDQTSELKKKELLNLAKKTEIGKKQFLRQMLDVVFGSSEENDALRKSILVKLTDSSKKSKEVKDSNLEKLKDGKKKKKRKSELLDETSYKQAEFARKRKLSFSIEDLRRNSREQSRRRRTCSFNFTISDLEPEKYKRNVRNPAIIAVSVPSTPVSELVDVQSGGLESKVDVHAKPPPLFENNSNRTESRPKKNLKTNFNENNCNLNSTDNQLVANFKSDKMLMKDGDYTKSNNYISVDNEEKDKITSENNTPEGEVGSSAIEIVFVGNIEKPSFEQEKIESERDEASESEGDIVPCEEINRMFTEDKTKAYQKVLQEGVKWKVHDSKTSSSSTESEDHSKDKSKEDSYANNTEDSKFISDDVLHGFGDKLGDSDANCNDSDIDVILETIVSDTGRESSVAGLKEELKRSKSSISNDDNISVSSLILSNGEGKEVVGAKDESVLQNAQTVALNCQESPAVEELCDLDASKDKITDISIAGMKERQILVVSTPMSANVINSKLNGKCEDISTSAKDKKTSVKSLTALEKACEESSQSSLHLQAADKKLFSNGHTALVTKGCEMDGNLCIEVPPEESELVKEQSTLTSCSKSPLQNGNKSMPVTFNGSNGDDLKKSRQCFDTEGKIPTASQMSSKSGSSLGGFVTALEDLETTHTAESNFLSASPRQCHIEVSVLSENGTTNSQDSLYNERLNGNETDDHTNMNSLESMKSEMKVTDSSPVSEGASVKYAKATDESFEIISNEGDEAYEASSDASEEPLPVSRKRTRSQRKLVQVSRINDEVSDSDFSPVHRSLRSRRTSESRKKNVCGKMNEKLMDCSNNSLKAKLDPESSFDDTSNMFDSTDTAVTQQLIKEIGEVSLQKLAANLNGNDKVEKEDSATDEIKQPYLSDSELGRTKLMYKNAVECIIGEKSSLEILIHNQTGMEIQSGPEIIPDGNNDKNDQPLYALESLASMHKLCESEKAHTRNFSNKGRMLLDNFSVLETNGCFNEKFSSTEENMQILNEEEGDEIEVLSSGLDEDEELSYKLSPENSSATDGCSDIGKGLTNTLRSRRLRKQSLDNNTNGKIVGRQKEDFVDSDIPQLKAQRVSEAVLKKEILISPEVSDEECELVSPEEDASRKKLQLTDNIIETPARLSKGTSSPFSMRGSRFGIRSPQKLIPEEQDESSPRRLKHSPFAKESPGQKTAKVAQRSSSSERGTVSRYSSSNSRKTDTSKITPHKNSDALLFANISPKKNASSNSASKEQKSLKPRSHDHDGTLRISDGTSDKGDQSGSGKSNLESGAKQAGIFPESSDSMLPKLDECNKLIGAEVPSMIKKMAEEDSVGSDSCDRNPCSSEADNSVSDTKSTDDSVSSLPSLTLPVRRSSRLSLSKVDLKGRTQSKALSPDKQTKLQKSNDSEVSVSPKKCKGLENLGKIEKGLKEKKQISPSHGSPEELLDISPPTTPLKSQMKNRGSASPSSVQKPSALASPSRGRPKKIQYSTLITRKAKMQEVVIPLKHINTRREGLISSVLGIKKGRLSLPCSARESRSIKINSPFVSPQKSLQDSKAADAPVVDSTSSSQSRSRSASSSPSRTSRSRLSRNVTVKLSKMQMQPDPAIGESDPSKSTTHSDHSQALSNVSQINRVSTRAKAATLCSNPSPKKLVKELGALSPALLTKKADQRSSALKGKASVNLQEFVEDKVNVSTRRLRHREVTYTTKS